MQATPLVLCARVGHSLTGFMFRSSRISLASPLVSYARPGHCGILFPPALISLTRLLAGFVRKAWPLVSCSSRSLTLAKPLASCARL